MKDLFDLERRLAVDVETDMVLVWGQMAGKTTVMSRWLHEYLRSSTVRQAMDLHRQVSETMQPAANRLASQRAMLESLCLMPIRPSQHKFDTLGLVSSWLEDIDRLPGNRNYGYPWDKQPPQHKLPWERGTWVWRYPDTRWGKAIIEPDPTVFPAQWRWHGQNLRRHNLQVCRWLCGTLHGRRDQPVSYSIAVVTDENRIQGAVRHRSYCWRKDGLNTNAYLHTHEHTIVYSGSTSFSRGRNPRGGPYRR